MSLIDPPLVDDEVTLAERVIAALISFDPDWFAADGGVEEQLAEAVAAPVATAAYAVRESIRGAYADVVGRVVRVQRSPQTIARAIATISVTSSAGLTLDPGVTEIGLTLDGEEIPFVLAQAVTFAPGATVQTGVELVAVDPGTAPNGASDPAQWTDARIAAVDVTTSARGGADEESDESLLARIERRASTRVSLAPSTAPGFAAAALDDAEVGRCAYRNRFDPDAPLVETLGHVTLWPITGDGADVSAECEARLAAQFAGDDDPLGVTVHIEAPLREDIAVAVQVTPAPGYSEAECTAAIEAAIPDRIGPAVFGYATEAPGRIVIPATPEITAFDVAAAIDDLPQLLRVRTATVNGGASVALNAGPVVLPNIISTTVTFA